MEYKDPIPILCEKANAINISKKPIMHSKTKHIPIKFHFLREQVVEKLSIWNIVATKEKIENIFIKAIPKYKYEYLRQKLVVRYISSEN